MRFRRNASFLTADIIREPRNEFPQVENSLGKLEIIQRNNCSSNRHIRYISFPGFPYNISLDVIKTNLDFPRRKTDFGEGT